MRYGSHLRVIAVLGSALALVAACGNGADRPAAPAPEVTSMVTPPEESVRPRSTPSTSGPTNTAGGSASATTVAGEAAPDFALELGNGGTFVLSEEARPVFMVFWAEW